MRCRRLLPAFLLTAFAGPQAVAADPPPDPAGVEFFEKRVRPLLAEHCHKCHGPDKQQAGLMLDSHGAVLKGGDRGPAIVPGKPDQSLLIRAVRYTDDNLRMPPKGKLKDEQIADLEAWVKMGAPGPKDAAVTRPAGDFDLAERRKRWAYQPVRPQALPAVKNREWCRSPIDHFILARLEAAGLSPTPPAERRTLIRRVTFDLIGLPPTPEEVEAFVNDKSPDAYEKLADRLLASPHYGERWGRHWLDVVRYSETLGFEFDYDLHNAWRYRDYVIRAFNADLPYDRFVIEHLAGDLVPDPRRHPTEGFNESITATGFFWMGEGKQTPVDIRQEQADRIDNQIDVLGKAFLAQTIACARCHDHKFDAIPTRDYYALAGYLKSSRYQQAFLDPQGRLEAGAAQLAALKAMLRDLIAAEVTPAWLDEVGRASRYLLAARKVIAASAGTNAEKIAAGFGVDAAKLGRWVEALRHKNSADLEHPLFAWRQLADAEGTAERFQRHRSALLAQLRAQSARALAAAKPFEDFRHLAYDGWFATGEAFGAGPARVGDIVIGESAARPVARFARGGADSGLVSDRLQGELRSRTFTIDKRYIHYRLSGRNARVNLVIDGYTLIMNPMYGRLTIPAPDSPAWRTMPVDRWVGQRAYIEVSDSSIPMHGLNPPPSTARAPEGPDGHVALEQVVLSDDPDPPAAPNSLNLLALEAAKADSPEALAAAYQELMIDSVKCWPSGKSAPDEIALLNWLTSNGLLDREPGAADSVARLLEKYRTAEASLPAPLRAPALADGTGEDESVFLRGNYRTPGECVPRLPPTVIGGKLAVHKEAGWFLPASAPAAGSGRLELARRLVDPVSNPLVARVMVNRIWHHHFGEGIVRTPDDFGRMGQPPTHPELLDYLATEFVRRGWSVKQMHRLVLLSSTYRQGSGAAARVPENDPENRLLHRMPVRRLEAEAIRDSILAVSGRLDRTLYGPSVLPYLTPHMEGRGRPNPGPLDGDGRRSIYLNARRNFLTPMFVAFDYPAVFTPVGRRGVTTVPGQALALMNDPFVVQQARRWAERVLAEPGKTPEQRTDGLYRTAFARPPTGDESRDAVEFVRQQAGRYRGGPDDPRAWADLCHVLINAKEFIFIE